MPEVAAGDNLVELLLEAVAAGDVSLVDGDVLVVSSKIVSKSLGLWAD
jgi:coenzyme F420-0:L-glutamate ligase/coenzyme F420-1:gamma-L-glutamate ligase